MRRGRCLWPSHFNEERAGRRAGECAGIDQRAHAMRGWLLAATSPTAAEGGHRDECAGGRSSWLRVLADNPGARWHGTIHVVSERRKPAHRDEAGRCIG